MIAARDRVPNVTDAGVDLAAVIRNTSDVESTPAPAAVFNAQVTDPLFKPASPSCNRNQRTPIYMTTLPTSLSTYPISATVIAIPITVIMSAFTLPAFMARLFRPLSSSARMGISADTGVGRPAGVPEGAETATIAAGCFWGVEHLYRKHFDNKGLYDARVGYIGGDTSHPTYRAVCTGKTGHSEALQIHYDPAQLTYRQLLEFFYRMHDPTTPNRQGPDLGSQYRSAIFYHSPEQEATAREVTRQAGEQWYGAGGVGKGEGKGGIVTEIVPAGQWWDAEDYHQLYLHKNPGGYECPSHFLRTFPPLQ
ncbi:peptide methionine sulfoxide reductase MsrA [Whalleya microplaca]|nr:peptide methionine sulfoxide reductase MsrA [Whalleya microplaca]